MEGDTLTGPLACLTCQTEQMFLRILRARPMDRHEAPPPEPVRRCQVLAGTRPWTR